MSHGRRSLRGPFGLGNDDVGLQYFKIEIQRSQNPGYFYLSRDEIYGK